MRVELKLRDFVNSKFCSPSNFRISGARIRERHTFYSQYKEAERRVGIGELRILCASRTPLTGWLNSVIPDFLYILKQGEMIEAKFEEFSVYCFYEPELEKGHVKIKGVLMMTNMTAVILPRKTPLETYRGEVYVVDKLDNNLYILPSLIYPARESELRRLCIWLRFKQHLVVRYKVEKSSRVHFRPAFASFKYWGSRAKIMTKNSNLLGEYIETIDDPKRNMSADLRIPQFETIIDFRDNQMYTYVTQFYDVKLLPIKPITQDLIDEWMEKERDRYKVYR